MSSEMKTKYLAFGLIAFLSIVGWNLFLIKRDTELYKFHYGETLKENIK